jgi:hypothetical protein
MAPSRSSKFNMPYSGFVLAFEPKRTEKVAERLYREGEAVETFSAMDWNFEPRELALLVLDRDEMSIGAAVLMERMHGSGGTGKLKMRLSNPVIFSKPVETDSVHDVLPLHRHVSTAENVRRIAYDLWINFITLIWIGFSLNGIKSGDYSVIVIELHVLWNNEIALAWPSR